MEHWTPARDVGPLRDGGADVVEGGADIVITLSGIKDPEPELGRLATWLGAQEELTGRVVREERPAADTMGLSYDLLVQVGGEGIFAVALVVLRSVRAFRANRRGDDDPTVRLRVAGAAIEIRPTDALTSAELEELATRVREAADAEAPHADTLSPHSDTPLPHADTPPPDAEAPRADTGTPQE
ncbi:hypothetical protein ABZ832_21540 [Streptantibioticus parmotrematis]|uniref:effector-associated constant component EACC1 n=1 Tax=Streptantibioticus parmotrematis TaxID=2873249 RepID=UPI0033D36D63